MRLVSVNVSLPRPVEFRGQAVSTSIFKEPVGGRVLARRLSLEGDWQADLRSHGGLNKAVYAYPREHYARWSQELGRDDLRPGQFGENLTVEGLTEETVRLGDVFRVGTGDAVELVEQSDALTVWGLWHLVLVDKGDVEGARRALGCPTLAR